MSEIIIKTGSDGTDADIAAKICDGAGYKIKYLKMRQIKFAFKVFAVKQRH